MKNKRLDEKDKKEGLLKRLKNIESKNEKQLDEIEYQGERQLDMIDKHGIKHLNTIGCDLWRRWNTSKLLSGFY